MRYILIASLSALALLACEGEHAYQTEMQRSSHWEQIAQPLSRYTSNEPDRPIIVAFIASWSKSTQINLAALQNESVSRHLSDKNYRCLLADAANQEELVYSELRNLGYGAVPETFIYIPSSNEWISLPHEFQPEPLLRNIIDAESPNAEPGGAE